MEVTFAPTSDAVQELGMEPSGYILGYLSIDEQVSVHIQKSAQYTITNVIMQYSLHVSRKTGYDIAPLRIDLLAGMEQPRSVSYAWLHIGTYILSHGAFHLQPGYCYSVA